MTGPWLVSYIALWILFLIIVVVLISVLRNMGILYQSIEQLTAPLPGSSKLAIGEELPKITLRDASGEPFGWEILENKTAALTVISPECGPCQALLRQLAQGKLQPDPTIPINVERLIAISIGDIGSTTRLFSEIGLNGSVLVLFDVNKKVSKTWGISSTPATLVVDKRLRMVNQIFGVKLEQVEMATA